MLKFQFIILPLKFSALTNIPLDYSRFDNTNIATCNYTVTRGASTEISNTVISGCGNTTFDVTSDSTTYVAHLTITDVAGNSNYTNSTFNVQTSTGGGDTGGGGGGSSSEDLDLFSIALGGECVENKDCDSGLCDPITKTCVSTLCGNGVCEESEKIEGSCSADCNILRSNLSNNVLFGLLISLIVFGCGFGFKKKKKENKKWNGQYLES